MTTDDVIREVRGELWPDVAVIVAADGVPDVTLPDAGPVAAVDLWPVPRWPSAAELRGQMRDGE